MTIFCGDSLEMRELTYNIFNILILFGSIQGFLLALMFVSSQKFNRKSNLFLATEIFVISLINFFNGLEDIGLFTHYPILGYLPVFWVFLIPVTLYHFIRYLTDPDYQFSKIDLVMYLPFLIHFSYQFFIFLSYLIKPSLLTDYVTVFLVIREVIELLALGYCFGFLIYILKHLNKYENGLKDAYAEIETKSLRWLRQAIILSFVLWAFWALPFFYQHLMNTIEEGSYYPLYLGQAVIIYWVGYTIYLRRDIFESEPTIVKAEEKVATVLSDKTEEHYQRLLALMEDEKLYENPDLNMTILAEKAGLSNGYLSQIINQKEGKNFFDFVNGYRVEAVKQKLADSSFSHYSLLGIGLESGFKSKSTFNAVFKKMTGLTPSAYKKSDNSIKTQVQSH